MRHDTLIVWDYVWKRYLLYVAMICIWSTLVFSYCPASFSPFVFKSLSLHFLSSLLLKLYLLIVPLLLFPYFLLHSFQAFLVGGTYFFSCLCQGATGPEGQSTTRPPDQNHRTKDHRTRGPQGQRSLNFFSRGCKYFFQGTWFFFQGT